MDRIRTFNKKWHHNVMNLLLGKNVCGSCLCLDSGLVHWDADYVLQRDEVIMEFSLKNIMLFTFGSRILDIVSTSKFCQKCIDEILKAYFFMRDIQDNCNNIEKKVSEISRQMKWTEQLDESGSLHDNKINISVDVVKMTDNNSNVKEIALEKNKNKHRFILDNESLKMQLVKDPEMHKYLFREINVKQPKLPPGITVRKIKNDVDMTDFAPHELLELNWANEPDYDAVIPNTHLAKQLHSNEALIMNLMEKAKTVGKHNNFNSHQNYHQISNKVSETLNLHDSLSVNLVQRLESNDDSSDNDLIPQDLLELKWPDEGDCTTKNCMKIPVKKLNFDEALTVKFIPKHIVSTEQEVEDEISPHELLELNWNEEPDKVDVKDSEEKQQTHNIDLAKWLQDQGMSIIKMENFDHENKKVHILNVQETECQNSTNPLNESITTENIKEVKINQNVTPEAKVKDTQSCSSDLDNMIGCNVNIRKEEVNESKEKNNINILRCALCYLSFDEFESYKSHYKTHNVTEYAKCYKCPAKYPIIELLSEHLLLIHSENMAYCNVCFAMLDQNHLAQHMTMYHEANAMLINIPVDKTETTHIRKNEYCKKCKQPYIIGSCNPHTCVNINSRCNECKNACIHERYLSHYRKEMKKNKEIFKCIDCKFQFKNKFEIIKHANKTHLKHKPHRCKVCNVTFLLKSSLGKHNTLHHARCNNCRRVFEDHVAMSKHRCKYTSNDVNCEMCGQKLDQIRYQQHKLNALSATDRCILCQKVIPVKCNMARHMLDIHKLCLKIEPDSTIFECIICERDFKNDADFSKHSWVHEGVHECHVCAKRFTSKSLYESHFQMHLATQCDFAKSFICSVCGEQLIDKYAWAHHMFSHNDYEKCQICSKYVQKDMINQHVESHELLEKKFKCPHCPLICNSHNQFEVHVNRFHLQHRPYECDVCKKCFYSKHMMREHINIHARLEQCHLCDRKFARKGNLDIHMRVHSNATKTTP